MSYKVNDRVEHLGLSKLGCGRIVAVVPTHSNACHDKPGPWYRVEWDSNPTLFAGRLFHDDVLILESKK